MVLREMVEMVEMVGWQRRLVKRMMRMVVRSDKRQLRMLFFFRGLFTNNKKREGHV